MAYSRRSAPVKIFLLIIFVWSSPFASFAQQPANNMSGSNTGSVVSRVICGAAEHTPFTNFNSSSNPATPTTLWVNIHTKLNGQLSDNGDFILFTNGTITLSGITASWSTSAVAAGKIIADSTVSAPVTYFNAAYNMWITKVPLGYSSADIFIAGQAITSSSGYVAGISKHTIVKGEFHSNRTGVASSWFYGAACYQPLFTNASVGAPGIIQSVSGAVNAGTPASQQSNLVAGGTGGGGSNYTGSNSSSDSYLACPGEGTIGNFVWKDLNRNGLQDAGEPGIAGVTVTLTLPGGITKIISTDADGIYSFDDLVPGIYSVAFSTPAGGFAPTQANANGSDLADSDPVGGIVNNITITTGEVNNSIDAGFTYPVNIYGHVWHDANAMDDGEVNKTSDNTIPNILVVYLVDDATGLVVDGYSLGQNGAYEFDDVQINYVYRLVLSTALADPGQPAPISSLPTGWLNTGENLGAGPFSGNDGQTDGRLFIETQTSDVHDANFGIRLGNGEIIIG